jgi:hypothetical protein
MDKEQKKKLARETGVEIVKLYHSFGAMLDEADERVYEAEQLAERIYKNFCWAEEMLEKYHKITRGKYGRTDKTGQLAVEGQQRPERGDGTP